MLDLGPNAGLHIFDVDRNFVDSRVLLKSPYFSWTLRNIPVNRFAFEVVSLIDASEARIRKNELIITEAVAISMTTPTAMITNLQTFIKRF